MKSAQSKSTGNYLQKVDYERCAPLTMGERNRSLESVFLAADQKHLCHGVIVRRMVARSSSNTRNVPNAPLSSPLSNSEYNLAVDTSRKSRSETHLNFQAEDFCGNSGGGDNSHQYNEVNEKTENILSKALKIALEKQKAYRKTELESESEDCREYSSREGSPRNIMMMSTPPPGVQTDSDGLILPKKIVNPCLESSDRKNLHRELMFNNKIGKSVLNQKTELQRVLEKKRERQILIHQQQETAKIESGLKGELNRVIMERAQKLEKQTNLSNQDQESESHVNPEYLNARARLRGRIEMK